jgi:hypothetical protein
MTRWTSLRRFFALSLALLSLVGLATSAAAQAYKYKDDRGRVHFTENLYDIPEKYRANVETREMPVHVPVAGSPEAAAAPPAEGSIAASFQQGVQEGLGEQSLSPAQQTAMNQWMKRWTIPAVASILVNIAISLGLVIHAFSQGAVGWGLANFFLGVTTPIYLMAKVEQGLATRLGLLFLMLSPVIVGIAAAVQLAGALA